MVGKVLKELYVDSALKRGENLDKLYESTKPQTIQVKDTNNLTWKEYKRLHMK
jgi:hypothetical protein